MKRYKSPIFSAEEFTAEDALKDSVDVLEDDFEFLLAGIEKIGRTDVEAGQAVVNEVSTALQAAIAELAVQLQDIE